MAGQYALPKKTPLSAGSPTASPSAIAAHQLLDTTAGELVAKYAPQYSNRIPPEKAKQTFREVLKTSDFMTKSFVMSIVGQHLPKGVTAEDITKAVNEKPPAAAAPAPAPAPAAAAAAPDVAAPAAAAAAPATAQAAAAAAPVAGTPQPAVQAGAGPAAVAAATAAAPAAPQGGGSGRAVITPALMKAIRQIESGGNPNARTGSYKGSYQLSDSEFARLGGKGSIFNHQENERIAALKLQQEADQVAKKLGRDLTPGEIYLVHQQGVGGATAHLTNPDRPAWQSMHSTGEGRSKGEGWSRLAIWGNVPDKLKAQYGSVDNLTSGEFTKMWSDRIARGGGGAGSSAPKAEGPLDPTPNVGAGESDYTAQAQAETAKSMVDPTPNVGSGASQYDATSSPAEVAAGASTLGKGIGAGAGDIFSGLGDIFAKGPVAQNAATKSGPANVPGSGVQTQPTGVVPTVDPRVAEMQRQQLAMALQRLNSGKLV